jgi:hypothetical protein
MRHTAFNNSEYDSEYDSESDSSSSDYDDELMSVTDYSSEESELGWTSDEELARAMDKRVIDH